MRIVNFVALFFICFNSQSQNEVYYLNKFDSLYKLFDSQVYTSTQNALTIAYEALDIAENLESDSLRAKVNQMFGNAYFLKSQLEESLSFYVKSLKYFEYSNDIRNQGSILNNIGAIYFQMSNYEKALEYFNKAAARKLNSGDSLNYAIIVTNIGNINLLNGNLDSVKKYYNQAFEIYLKLNNDKGIGDIYNNYAEYYIKISEFNTALIFLDQSITKYDKINNRIGIATNYNNKGQIYFKLNNLNMAFEYFNSSLKISDDLELKYLSVKNLYSLSKICQLQNKPYTAMDYMQKLCVIKDSIFNEEMATKSLEYESQLKASQQNQENLELKNNLEVTNLKIKQQKHLRDFLIGLVSFLVFTLVTFMIQYRIIKKKNRFITIQADDLQRINKELKRANSTKDKLSSILAHEIRNPLNSINGFSYLMLRNPKKYQGEKLHSIIENINKASNSCMSLLDNILIWSKSESNELSFNLEPVLISEVIQNIERNYTLNLSSKSIEFINSIPEDVVVSGDKIMIDLIFRNIISNAIKYTDESGIIKIWMEKSEKFSTFFIEDSGIGIPEKILSNLLDGDINESTKGTQGERGTGLGLKIVNEFVKLHKGTIKIKSEINQGSLFVLNFPLEI